MQPWWHRWPDRLSYEVEALRAAGYTVDEPDTSSKFVTLRVTAPAAATGTEILDLSVTFPDGFPYLAPEVAAPTLSMPHHQHPFGHTLCLLGRRTVYWDSSMTVARLLDEQLAKALAAGNGATGSSADELDQGEPFSNYYTYEHGTEIIAALDEVRPDTGAHGVVDIAFHGPLGRGPRDPRLVGFVQRLRTDDGVEIHQAPPQLGEVFSDPGVTCQGRWVVLAEPLPADDGEALWDAAESHDARPAPWVHRGNLDVSVRLVGFPEETSRTSRGVGWVAVIQSRTSHPAKTSRSGNPSRRSARPVRSPDVYAVVAVHYASQAALRARSPRTAALSERRVVVVGVGALGSVVVDHLARAGVGSLRLVDYDTLEPGNLSRHAGSLMTTGLAKSVAMAQHARLVNPYTDVEAAMFAVGRAALVEGRRSEEYLADWFDDAHLVVDASAEVGVQEMTAALARDLAVPWLMLSASHGACGGTVVLVPPDGRWCFGCFQWHRVDGNIPFPPESPEALVQPVGCADPTFVGSGFDLAEVALHAVRVAAAHLTAGCEVPYPTTGFDAYVLSMLGPDGSACVPRWEGFHLTQHKSCRAHER